MKLLFEDVKLFEDINFNKPVKQIMGKFNVEVSNNNKARVICDSPYVSNKDNTSRLNKLTSVGSWAGGDTPNRYGYSLIVNGHRVYFIVERSIYDINDRLQS